jgi:hypothetical protein
VSRHAFRCGTTVFVANKLIDSHDNEAIIMM